MTPFSKWYAAAMLAACYFVVAAAAYSGSFAKWAFRDGERWFALPQVLEGTAYRPFVYRQLVPQLANAVDRVLPAAARESLTSVFARFGPAHDFVRATDAANPLYSVRYHVVYALGFLALWAALFALRAVCIDASGSALAGTLAPAAFMLALPFLLSVGGYFYDFFEILFLALGALAAGRGSFVGLLTATVMGTLNKESYIFFLPALYPLLAHRPARSGAGHLASAIGLAAVISIAVRVAYRDLPGGMAQLHLLQNIKTYIDPRSYFELEQTYGVIGPGGLSVVFIAVVIYVVARAWPEMRRPWQRHMAWAAAINLPLFLVFCYRGELRNLSLCYVAITVATAALFAMRIRSEARP